MNNQQDNKQLKFDFYGDNISPVVSGTSENEIVAQSQKKVGSEVFKDSSVYDQTRDVHGNDNSVLHTNINLRSDLFISISINTSLPHYLGELLVDQINCTSEGYDHFSGETYARFATEIATSFIQKPTTICIGNKIQRAIEKYASKSDLKKIHPDELTAIEIVLIIASNFSDTHVDRVKQLNAEVMNSQVSDQKDWKYRPALDILFKGTKEQGPIIELMSQYSVGKKSRSYQLTDNYWRKGTHYYELKSQYARDMAQKRHLYLMSIAFDSFIAKNYLFNLHNYKMPSLDDVKKEGIRICKEGYEKNGKNLIYLNKRKFENLFPDEKERKKYVPLEVHLELYELLLRFDENGTYEHRVPVVANENGGGRVYSSINLCMSWIRELIKIQDESTVSVDYKCLHPNIAVKLYGGNTRYITHDMVADKSGHRKEEVKKDHLSFFNLKLKDQHKNKLYQYYLTYEQQMVNAMKLDKAQNGDLETTKKMFAVETAMMSECIARLQQKGIIAIYEFDALRVRKSKREETIKVMDEVAQEFGIYTTAK